MAMPIFILEGPDNGGKSTLAKVMARKYGAEIIHSTYRFKDNMLAYHFAQFRKALCIAQNKPVVMDRWWPSELVYGNVYRGSPEDDYRWRILSDYGKLYNCLYTFCLPYRWEEYWEWCQKVWKADEEMYELKKDNYQKLHYLYRELAWGHHSYYPGNLYQNYNVCLEGPLRNGGTYFADYVLARWKSELLIMSPQRKAMMNHMAKNWRFIGREKEYVNVNDHKMVAIPPQHSETRDEYPEWNRGETRSMF